MKNFLISTVAAVLGFLLVVWGGSYKWLAGIPVSVFVFKNETFSFYIKTPTTSFLLKNLLVKNSSKHLTLLDVYKVALIKHLDLRHLEIEAVFKNVLQTAKTLNIKITYD